MLHCKSARGGRSTLVLEKDVTGYGCSSRNGGQAGTSYKPKFGRLAKRFGEADRPADGAGRAPSISLS